MIPFSDIFFNAILESLDGVVNFSVILGYGIRQNVKYVQILTVFVSLNDAILDDGYFLNSCAEKQILLSEQFHDEESVVRDGFSADWVHITILATVLLAFERTAAVELALC